MLASAPQAVVEAFDALAQRQSSGVAYFAERAESSKTNADTLVFATAIIRYAPKLFDTMQAVHAIETRIMLTEARHIAIIARRCVFSFGHKGPLDAFLRLQRPLCTRVRDGYKRLEHQREAI